MGHVRIDRTLRSMVNAFTAGASWFLDQAGDTHRELNYPQHRVHITSASSFQAGASEQVWAHLMSGSSLIDLPIVLKRALLKQNILTKLSRGLNYRDSSRRERERDRETESDRDRETEKTRLN